MRADRSDARGGLERVGGRGVVAAAFAATVVVLSGCGENGQSTLSPHSPQSRDISTLWWWMLGVAWVVLGGTCVLLLMSFIRRRREGLPWLRTDEGVNTRLVIGFGVVI